MGKGDRKTKRGKINKGTFGVRRPKAKKKAYVTVEKPKPKRKTTRKKKE